MTRRTVLLLLFVTCYPLFSIAQEWREDILSSNFEQMTFDQGVDYSGQIYTTLVRRTPLLDTKRALLYLHGYNDYFFQEELAERFRCAGYNVYALDLRKYGRSIVDGTTPFEVRDLSEYFEDLDVAIAQIIAEGNDSVTLMGHSTGGLILSLYCENNQDSKIIDALLLNSPFFDINSKPFVEKIILPVVSLFGKLFPKVTVLPGNQYVSPYAMSLLSQYHGEWSFDKQKKFPHSLNIYSGWLRAIYRGHRQLQRGLNIQCPILILRSDNSVYGDTWSPAHASGDSVLSVEDIEKYSHNIGYNYSIVTINNALHDIILSAPEVRNEAYEEIFKWLNSCNAHSYE